MTTLELLQKLHRLTRASGGFGLYSIAPHGFDVVLYNRSCETLQGRTMRQAIQRALRELEKRWSS